MWLALDVRLALRASWRRRWSVLAALAIVVLGLTTTAALFIVLDAFLLQPLPFRDPDQLYVVGPSGERAAEVVERTRRPDPVTQMELEDLLAQPGVRATLGYSGRAGLFTRESSEAEGLRDALVTPSFFEGLGVRPVFGRSLDRDDAEAIPRRVLISYSLWAGRLARDLRVVGDQTTLGGQRVEIVGVMPQRFSFPSGANVWAMDAGPHDFRGLVGVVRAPSGVLRPDILTFSGRQGVAVPLAEYLRPPSDQTLPLAFLLFTAGIALAMTWLHVGALRAVEIFDHARETAVRMAMGASTWQVIRQQIAENVLFVAGVLVASAALLPAITRVAAHLVPPSVTVGREMAVDERGLAFLGLATLFGLAMMTAGPMRAVTRSDLLGLLKNESQSISTRSSGGRRAVLIAQVGLVTALLYVTGLLMSEMIRMQRFDLGFNPDDLLVIRVNQISPTTSTRKDQDSLGASKGELKGRSEAVGGNIARNASISPADPAATHRALLEQIRAVAGVTAASTGFEPFYVPRMPTSVGLDGLSSMPAESRAPNALYQGVSPGFFHAIGTPILEGRDFDWGLDQHKNVVILSRSLARALGRPSGMAGCTVWINGGQYLVVGVTGDIRANATDPMGERPYLYFLAARTSPILVRVSSDRRGEVVARIESAVRAVTGQQGRLSILDARQSVAAFVAPHTSRVMLAGLQAGAALVLGVLGLYALAREVLRRRLHSVAVRKALGAPAQRLVLHISAPVITDAGIGLLLGLLLGVGAGCWLSAAAVIPSRLAAIDVWAALLAIASVLLASVLALVSPARRAARLDPSVLLRLAQ